MKRKNFLVNFLSSIDNNEENFKDTRELLTISDNAVAFIPGTGMYVPNLYTIRAPRVNKIL